jgi:nucleotide-binding universal stress UspA family protein
MGATFRNILCPVDFSAGSRAALEAAVGIAVEGGGLLTLVHAWYVPAMRLATSTVLPPHAIDTIREEAAAQLATSEQDARRLGATRVDTLLVEGPPWQSIVDAIERGSYDLCVVGTHGRTGLARLVMGSIAEKVIRHAPCSVLAAREAGQLAPVRHVLCPTDFSDGSRAAFDLALALVPSDGRLTLLHVIDLPFATGGTASPDLAHVLDHQGTVALEEWTASIPRAADRQIVMQSRVGAAGAQVIAAADEDATIDLVVMGSHGRTGVARAVMGSVAEKVVRHARCAVLIARQA